MYGNSVRSCLPVKLAFLSFREGKTVSCGRMPFRMAGNTTGDWLTEGA